MARILIAGAVGAVVYYIWGMLAWMAIPIHDGTLAPLPEAAASAVASQELSSGVYVSPFTADTAEMGDPESAFQLQHRAGPIFSVYFRREGAVPMGPPMLVGGFLIALASSLLAAYWVSRLGPGCQSYLCRAGFVASLGLFVAIVGHLSYWNWMYFPLGYTVAFMVDVTVGWSLAGLAIAALVPPNREAALSAAAASAIAAKPASDPVAKPATSQANQSKPAPPTRNDAISLLAALQREARFVDIVKESLDSYSDAQVGAAARDVLRDCGTVLDRLFQLQPIMEGEEGAQVTLTDHQESAEYRLTGNATSDVNAAALVHHGWKATQCELPQWTGSARGAMVVAPAELEAK